MKIRVVSDLHVNINKELSPFWNKKDDILTLIAGDVSDRITTTRKYLSKNFKRCIFIEGNHILYPTKNIFPIQHIYEKLKNNFPKKSDITFLQDSYKIIDDVCFIGTTLWTDFSYVNSKEAKEQGEEFFKNSKMKHAVYIDNHGRVKKVSIEFFGSIYKKSLAYIYKTSKKFPDKKIVLIFHHAISKKSIDPKYLNHPSLPSVLTDIAEQLVDSIPNLKLIIHGHVHQSHDYWIKNVRVICNPCGIVNKEPKLSENPNFNKDFIVEI